MATNAVTVADLKGKWKKSEPNAMGELRYVKEPAPGGGEYVTEYQYSELGQMVKVIMAQPGKGTGNGATVTQERTWVKEIQP